MTDLVGRFLVDTAWLAAHHGGPDIRIFDCTTTLVPDAKTVYRIQSGRADYQRGHIPGAGFIDLQADLSDPDSALRFTMLDPLRFAAAAGRLGIGDGTAVILYCSGAIWWATLVWWMLRAMGFDNAAVLDGGFGKWQSEGRPVSAEPCAYRPAKFTARPRPRLFADKNDVVQALASGNACVINALSSKQHRGEPDAVHYGRPGHIAGSVNVPGMALVGKDQVFLPRAELAAALGKVGAEPGKRIVTYCGGGIAATANAFALTMLGHDNVAVYDGSLSEWAADPSLPMQTGE